MMGTGETAAWREDAKRLGGSSYGLQSAVDNLAIVMQRDPCDLDALQTAIRLVEFYERDYTHCSDLMLHSVDQLVIVAKYVALHADGESEDPDEINRDWLEDEKDAALAHGGY